MSLALSPCRSGNHLQGDKLGRMKAKEEGTGERDNDVVNSQQESKSEPSRLLF